MAVLTPRSVFRRYEVDGVPSSGSHVPIKDEIVQLLEQVFGVSRGGWVVSQTLAELTGVTPENETDGGVVLADPDPANNGYYQRDGGVWVRGRGFPDTFARVALSGNGSAQTGVVEAGVNPADAEVFFAFVEAENDGALTLAIGGEAPREVVNLAGQPLSAGEWTGAVMFALRDGKYQLLLDAGAAASAAQSASDAKDEADRAEQEADRSEAGADRAENSASSFIEVATNFKTVANLLADETMGYAGSGKDVIVGEGDIATAQGFRYEVLASDAVDFWEETAGNLRLNVVHHQPGIHVGAYGEIGGANAAPAIQKMVDDLGYFILPEGNLNVQDPIVIGTSLTSGTRSIGAHSQGLSGPERSVLVASGMAGESVITFDTGIGALARHSFSNFGVSGDSDTAIDIGETGYYQSRLYNLNLRSIAGPAIRNEFGFSLLFENVYAWSDEDHAFDLSGGNTYVLQNCYAIRCGPTSAGYRLRSGATLIGCNGLNQSGSTHQGMLLGQDGQYPTYHLIGCNIEDFGDVGLKLRGGPTVHLVNSSFQGPAAGSIYTLIHNDDPVGANTTLFIDGATRGGTKGAARIAPSNIVIATGARIFVEKGGPNPSLPTDWEDAFINSLLVEVAHEGVSTGNEFGKHERYFSRLSSGRFIGMFAPVPTNLPTNATQPNVSGENLVVTTNSSPTGLLGFLGGIAGQELTLVINDGNTTIRHNVGGAGRMFLKSKADETPANGEAYKFVYHASIWKQV